MSTRKRRRLYVAGGAALLTASVVMWVAPVGAITSGNRAGSVESATHRDYALGGSSPARTGGTAEERSADTPVIFEDFSTADAAGRFTDHGGKWTVTAGGYHLTAPVSGTSGNGNIAVNATRVTGDVTVQAELRVDAADNKWGDASLLFGYQDVNNYLYLSLNQRSDANTSGLFRVAAGKITRLAEVSTPVTLGQANVARVDITAGRVRAYLDGRLVADAATDVPDGLVGFGSRNNPITADDLVVMQGAPQPVPNPGPSSSPGPTGSPTGAPPRTGGFVHPGITLTKAELDVVKSEVTSGAQPRTAGWAKLRSDKVSGLGYRPSPRAVLDVNGGSNALGTDSAAALSHALQWYVTGDKSHAEKAVEILDAWSGTLRTVKPGPGQYNLQHRLQAGWLGATLVEAAEIIRYTYPGWDTRNVDRFSAMLRNVLWPLVSANAPTCGDSGPGCQFQGRGHPRVSNHEASYAKTQLAIGVFLDDRAKFDAGVARYQEVLRGDIDPATGENNETCRDQGHTQMALGELVQSAEIGESQGLDLYGAQNSVLALGLEYTAKVLAGVPAPSHCGTQRSTARLFPMWEMGYNHYHNLEKKPMDYSGKAVARNWPEGLWFTGMFAWMTLTHSSMPAA